LKSIKKFKKKVDQFKKILKNTIDFYGYGDFILWADCGRMMQH